MKISEGWITFLIVGGICTVVMVPILSIVFFEGRADARAVRECGLYPGDIVTDVLDGARGMVTGAVRGNVRVRFAANSERTDTHVLRPDDSIAREPYSEIWMGCYELRKENLN